MESQKKETMMDKDTIKNLSPSAARYVLALLTSRDDSTEYENMVRAGINVYAVYFRAKKELEQAGILVNKDGHRYVVLEKYMGD